MKCSKCEMINRPGAQFCSSCGNVLIGDGNEEASPPATRPLQPDQSVYSRNRTQTVKRSARRHTDTQPLSQAPSFDPRPKGAIFGETFLYEQLVFTDAGRHEYVVSQFGVAQRRRIRMCPNPSCGAVYSPQEGVDPDRYCTDCHSELGADVPELLLIEMEIAYSESVAKLAASQLPHGSVRVPVAIFSEIVAGALRYCMVSPRTQPLPYESEAIQVLKWGIALAQGLDFLHANGVYFEGEVNADRFGKAGDHPAWVYFSGCAVADQVPEGAQAQDVRALAAQLFLWTTGKSQYQEDANLLPAVSRFYQEALSGPGLGSAEALAKAIEKALEEAAAQIVIDYRVGRRSHVGIQRTLNEDGVLVIEACQIKQSVARPSGFFAVADGMGGHAAGEIASGTIISVLAHKAVQELTPLPDGAASTPDYEQWLREAVLSANQAVLDLRKAAETDMGSTLVGAILVGDRAYIAHVGDSRAYIINGQGIRRVTIDHSLVERLISTNQITREEAHSHPQRNVVYRTMGDKPKLDVDITVQKLAVGDYLLLCSDGLSGMVEDKLIRDLVLMKNDPQAACDALISAANAAGGEDNISVVVVKLVLVA